jgi:hypothetical protein
LEIYVDGVLEGQSAATGSIAYTLGSALLIGKHGNGGVNHAFNGSIDQVRVFNRALSAAEVAALAAEDVDTSTTATWTFDEGSGSTANDSSGGGNHGQLVDGPAWVAGMIGDALVFDGVNDRVEVTSPTGALKPANAFSISAWVKYSSTGSNGGDVASMGDSYVLRVRSNGNVHTAFYDGTTWKYLTTTGINTKDGQWHHLVGQYTGTQLQVYVDGVLAAQSSTSGSIAYTLGQGFVIGNHGNGATGYEFNGLIDQLRIYPRGLSLGEVAALGDEQAWPVNPTILSLTPTSGGIGQSVTIAGSEFGTAQGSSTVTFNGTQALVTSWSDTSVTATVPSGATTGPVTVMVGGSLSNGVQFTVTTGPAITSLGPTSGSVGTAITIYGTGFGATQSGGSVTFNGTLATVHTWTPTGIVASVPTGAITGSVVVTAAGQNSNGHAFTVLAAPTISAVQPESADVGESVTISGAGFGSTPLGSAVTFDGMPAEVTHWSDTTITAVVPEGASMGPVVVRVGAYSSNATWFAPTGPGCSALPGVVYQQNWSAGVAPTGMKSNGDNYWSTQWGGTDGPDSLYPEIAASETVTVTQGAGPDGENVLDRSPALPDYGVSGIVLGGFGAIADGNGGPSWWDASEGCVSVTYNWTSDAFDQNVYSPLLVLARDAYYFTAGLELIAERPTNDPNNWTLNLGYFTDGAGWVTTNSHAFTRPSTENQWHKFEVRWKAGTFDGQNAAADGWIHVYWNGVLVYNINNVSLLLSEPQGAPNQQPNLLRTAWLGFYGLFGPTTNLVIADSNSAGPRIIGVDSTVGIPAATTITITGERFGATQGASSVTFNGAAATPVSWSDTQIVTTVPAGATSGPMIVTVNGIESNSIGFVVSSATLDNPVITAVNPRGLLQTQQTGRGIGGGDLTIARACVAVTQSEENGLPVWLRIRVFLDDQLLADRTFQGVTSLSGYVQVQFASAIVDRVIKCEVTDWRNQTQIRTQVISGAGPGSLLLKIASFIQYSYVGHPVDVSRIEEGDARMFTYTGGSARQQSLHEVYNPAVNDADVLSLNHGVGLSVEYDRDTSTDGADWPFGSLTIAAKEDWIPGYPMKLQWAEPVFNQPGEDNVLQCDAPERQGPSYPSETSTHRFRCIGAVSNPLIFGAPAIDWKLTFTLSYGANAVQYQVEGCHDGFPSYEVYANGVPLIQTPDDGEVWSLFFPCDVPVSISGVIQ